MKTRWQLCSREDTQMYRASFKTRLTLLATACLLTLLPVNELLAQTTSEPEMIRMALIGDSIVSEYATERPLRGWGQMLPEFFDSSRVEFFNFAAGGRSSKSFILEGRWQKVLDLEPAPDYVLIQFGHNDNPGKGEARETIPGSMPEIFPAEGIGHQELDYYRANLARYVRECREIGATPIIVTSPERCVFDGEQLRQINGPYSDAAVETARALDVTLVDLHAFNVATYQELGQRESLELHAEVDGRRDRSHYNERGARLWARFIAERCAEQIKTLAPYIDVKDSSKAAADAVIDGRP